jgi:hypothetical protein
MSAEHMAMRINGTAVWHVKDGTIEITLQSMEPPPRPAGVREDLWYGGAGDTLSVVVPARKAVTAPSTGIAQSSTVDPVSGLPTYKLYTWNATTQTWGTPVACDSNGNPL